jgi:hypothetical protein
LNLLCIERDLLGTIIQIAHVSFGSQNFQGLKKPGRSICIIPSAQG